MPLRAIIDQQEIIVKALLKLAAVVALGALGLVTPAAASATNSQLWTGGSVTAKLSDK